MANEKRLNAYNPITFESFTRHATKHIDPYYDPYGEGFTDAVDAIEGWIKNNTVDAVEVVRCKDCEYSENVGRGGSYRICHYWSPFKDALVPNDGFCYRGERKDNERKTD